jgi:parallel beta-helix repeat protein
MSSALRARRDAASTLGAIESRSGVAPFSSLCPSYRNDLCRLVSVLLIVSVFPARGGDGRIEISQDMMPFTIDSSGSYVVTENLTGSASVHGITIAADNVTLDLNGFELVGVANSDDGISTSSGRRNLVILNGIIRAWDDDGVDAESATNVVVRNLLVSRNGDDGVRVGPAGRVHGCLFYQNTGNAVVAFDGSIVSDCVVRDNSGNGIVVSNGCVVRDSVSRANSDHGILAGDGCNVIACSSRSNGNSGIEVGRGSVVVNCSAQSNDDDGFRLAGEGINIVNCAAVGNDLYGVRAGGGCSILSCTASENQLGAYYVSSNCYVRGNNAFANGFVFTNSAYVAAGDGNRIDQNHASSADIGFEITGVDNLVIRNSSSDNISSNFHVVPGNAAGSVSGDPDSANPWDNFEF